MSTVIHIVSRDHGTHISTVCGRFGDTVEQLMQGNRICKKCKKEFMQTPEQIKAYTEHLIRVGESFRFDKGDKP